MREAPVATEKNAVERAMRPPWPPARSRQDEFLARVERLGLAHGDVGVDRASRRGRGVGCLGPLQASVSVAIVGGRPEPQKLGGTDDMANIASQKKRILRSERERTENRLLTSTVKTHFRRLEAAVEAGDAERSRKSSAS